MLLIEYINFGTNLIHTYYFVIFDLKLNTMPQIFTDTVAPSTLWAWHITESLDTLLHLSGASAVKILDKYRFETHQKQFLVKQILLKKAGLDQKIDYLETGKPILNTTNFISITHAHQYVFIAESAYPVGIDVEFKNKKLIKIAPRFVHPDDCLPQQPNTLSKLQQIWTAKESIYKLAGIPGLSFKNDIRIINFDDHNGTAQALLQKEQKISLFFKALLDDFLLCQAFLDEKDK